MKDQSGKSWPRPGTGPSRRWQRRNTSDKATSKSGPSQQEPRIQSILSERLRWIDIHNPTTEDIEYLAANCPFHKLELDDCLSRIQRPKIDYDEEDNYLFLVFHFPVFNKEARVTTVSQVSIFLGKDYLITLHEGNLKPLTALFTDCNTNEDTREEMMSHSPGYLMYQILDRLVTYCFPLLNKIGTNIDAVEEQVFGDDARKAVRELSMLRRDVLSFRRMIKPQTEVLEWLEKSELSLIKEDPEVYFGDLADHNHKIMDTLDEYKEVIDGLNDTNNTLASFRINQVMRVLTVISVILLPLTLIASVYGMNVDLPLKNDAVAFPVLVAIMAVIMLVMLAFFRAKRWI